MNLLLDIQQACSGPVPDEAELRRWISAALDGQREADTEISLRLVDDAEMSQLNQTWRGKRGPTNVLSFPCELPAGLDLPMLGDIVICAPVVQREAAEQGKPLQAHWAHMLVHGTLHLLGFDHIDDTDAEIMEALESRILGTLNYPCPYRGDFAEEHARA